MDIYAICVVKNEEDIIKECLEHASSFCKKIFVYDTGSDDKTWEIVCELAKKRTVVPYKKENVPFRNGLRSEVFSHYKRYAKPEDWWYILDADEFLKEAPHDFIKNRIKSYETVIWSKHISFYYTDRDYEKWKEGKETLESRKIPIGARRRYYKCDTSEPRLFKHRDDIRWDIKNSVPSRLGVVARARIPVKHYKWRDPEQIIARMRTRKIVDTTIEKGWIDINLDDFETHIADSHALSLDDGVAGYQIHEEVLPLHLGKKWRRALKIMLYFLRYKCRSFKI